MTPTYFTDAARSAIRQGAEPLGQPGDDVVEITVMGPGLGESIVVHLGAGAWIIIDTFRLPQRRKSQMRGWAPKPAPVLYLQEIGVKPREAVRAVIVTHAHADHYGGILEVFDACTSDNGEGPALFLPAGMSAQALAVLAKDEATSGMIEELRQTTEEAREKHRLEFMLGRTTPQGLEELTVLAPVSEATMVNAEGKRTLDRAPNLTSIVLWLAVGKVKALLGADLDEHSDLGWATVLDAQRGVLEGAGLVKIPHHGSPHAHVEAVYQDLAADDYAAVGTANLQGTSRDVGSRRKLPNDKVVEFHAEHARSVLFAGGEQGTSSENAGSRYQLGWITARSSSTGDGVWDVTPYGKTTSS